MTTTNPVPSNDPTDLLFNAQKLDEVVSGTSQYYTDRLGASRRTVAGINAAADVVLGGLGYAPPVAYASGISLTLTTQTVEYSGEVYAPKLSNLPFTTTTWATDSAKFRLIQGVAATDLAASGGASMIGYMPAGTGAVATNVQDALRSVELNTKNTYNGLTSSLHKETSFLLLGDSITEGVGVGDYTAGYSYQFMRSLMNATDDGFGQDPGYGYHTIVNMANQLSEPGVTTTGSLVGGGVVGSRLSLAAGQSITITGKEIAFLDFIYDGSLSSGSLVYAMNGTTIATKVISGTGLQSTFPTALNAAQTPIAASDTVVVTASGGTVVVTGILPYKESWTGKPLMYAVAKSGTAYQDYTSAAALDELAYYLNFSRSGKVNVIVLALGTNNIYNPSKALSPANTVAQITALISGLESRIGTDIYPVISIPPKATAAWPVALPSYTYEDYVDAIANYAEQRFATLVRNDLSLLSRTSVFYSDGVHPNEIGHNIMAHTFCEAVGIPLRPQKPQSVALAKKSYTPVVSGSTTDGTGTYTNQSGTYTKIGPLVFFTVELSWSAHTGTGILNISLPSKPSVSQLQAMNVFYDGLTVGAGKQVSAIAFDDRSARMALTALDPSTGGYTFLNIDSAVTKLVISGSYFSA